MNDMKTVKAGHVYVLEVKDIRLPVCKIGMTTRSPAERCSEINRSSTGDFIWSVSSSVTVDDCRKLESLVHSKLSPIRQKGREFFGLYPDDAHAEIVSVLESQEEVRLTGAQVPGSTLEPGLPDPVPKRSAGYDAIDLEHATLLQRFAALLQVKGRPFGQTNKPRFGMSDGNRGVQWNLAITPATGEVDLGVNLEGSEKTGKWLISPFLLSSPDILSRILVGSRRER